MSRRQMRHSAGSVPGSLGACSACDGDYEDPERTAWSDALEEEDADGASATQPERGATGEGVPVREE